MLNLGQVVYDVTNDRVLFFCGMEMYSSSKGVDKRCFTVSAFIDENGTVLKNDSRVSSIPFTFTNFVKNDKPYSGTAIDELKCDGCFFGVLDYDRPEVKDAAMKAVQTMKEEIAVSGIKKEKHMSYDKGEYTKVIIKAIIVEKKRRLRKTTDTRRLKNNYLCKKLSNKAL